MDQQHHILFVDDEQLLHGLFERLFSRHGIKITTCMSAMQAVEELKHGQFDLVVTDFMMPDMDGLELLAHIRQEYPRTRVIMITAHANVQHAVRTMKNGAIDYIPKPFSTTELVDRVQKVLAEKVEEPGEEVAVAKPKRSRAKRSGAEANYVGEHPSIRYQSSLRTRRRYSFKERAVRARRFSRSSSTRTATVPTAPTLH
jgi:DNA-binding NtrC family response regulator